MNPVVPRRPLFTERLTLAPISFGHAAGLNEAALASMDELSPWMEWIEGQSLTQSETFCREMEEKWSRGEAWVFTILVDDEPAGTVGLAAYVPVLHLAVLGYWIRSDLAGRGLMKEATRAVVAFGFDVVGLHRIELQASPENIASVRVAEGVGFQREGFARDVARNVKGYYDCITFGMLETDARP